MMSKSDTLQCIILHLPATNRAQSRGFRCTVK